MSNTHHEHIVCKHCDAVILTCRCIHPKHTTYGVCENCKAREQRKPTQEAK